MILRGFLAVNPNRGLTYCSASLSSFRSPVVRTASSPAVEYCFSFSFAEATDSIIHILRPGDRPDRYAAIRGRRVELSRIRKTVSDAHQRTREVTVDHKTATRGHQPSSWNLPEMLTAKELEALLKIDVKTIMPTSNAGSFRTLESSRISASQNSKSSAGSRSATFGRAQ